jgi:hypothetical protein
MSAECQTGPSACSTSLAFTLTNSGKGPWLEAVALKRYRSHPMMLIGDEPLSYPSYRDIAIECAFRNVCWRKIWCDELCSPLSGLSSP